MSRAAFVMLMAPASEAFKVAFASGDLVAIEAALDDLRRLNRAYYGRDALQADRAAA